MTIEKIQKIVWKITKYFTLPMFALLILVAIFGPEVEEVPTPTPTPTLVSTYTDWYVVNPASGVFTVKITNTSTKEIKEISCTVKVNDGGSAYRGFGIWDADFSIPAGETRELRGRMTITNEGSPWVNQGTAECEGK
jgi:hypothetical protein